MDYSGWRKAWERRKWKNVPDRSGVAYDILLSFADGTEYQGVSSGPSEHAALARVYALARADKVARHNLPSEVIGFVSNPLLADCALPCLIARRRIDPDKAREQASVQAKIETDAFALAKKAKDLASALRSRFDSIDNPIRWTDKELALAESRADALNEMLANEKAIIRRIRKGIEKETRRKATER